MTIEQLIAVGGAEWKKADKHRIYFNNLDAWVGLDCAYYNTGNISSARLNGDSISNSQARRIMSRLSDMKIWWDVATAKFWFKGDQETAMQIIAAIKAKVGDP